MRAAVCAGVLILQALLTLATRAALKEEELFQKAKQERENAEGGIGKSNVRGDLVKAVLWLARVLAFSALLGEILLAALLF